MYFMYFNALLTVWPHQSRQDPLLLQLSEVDLHRDDVLQTLGLRARWYWHGYALLKEVNHFRTKDPR